MYELKDYQIILQEKATKAEEIFAKYPEIAKDDVRRFRDINETKIKNGKPEIMVYGIYNAGKSSILNELMGEDRAKVADKPETDKVTHYDWQGYKFADTPGVSAPIEHEAVTQEHLKKADIVLFVMSTTGSSEKQDNYDRMKAIADSGKKIIIVLNDKNGDLGRNDEAIRIIKQKVDTNMRRTGIENVEGKYCIVTVNADRARQGRIKGKPALIEMSGMAELKDVVLAELTKTSSFDVLRQSITELEKILDTFIEGLTDGENSAVLKKMNHVLETFDREKSAMRRQVNLFIDMQADNLAATLPQKIWDTGGNSTASQELLKHELEDLAKRVQVEIQHQIEDAIAILNLELKSFVEIETPENSEDAESLSNVLNSLSKKIAEINGTVEQDSLVVGEKVDNSSIDLVAANVAANLVSTGGQQIMKSLAKTAIGKTVAKTVVGKMLGNVAGGLIPVIGPAVTVISALGTLKDLLGSNKEYEQMQKQLEQKNERERQRIAAAMQARQELNQKCIYIVNNAARSIKENAGVIMKDTLKECETPFRLEIESRKNKGKALMDVAEKIRELKGEYSELRIELGGH